MKEKAGAVVTHGSGTQQDVFRYYYFNSKMLGTRAVREDSAVFTSKRSLRFGAVGDADARKGL